MKSSLSSLFKLTTAIGSIKRVEPVDDWSCIMPGTLPLASAFTGRQYLPSRMVTTASCRYVLVVLLFMSLVSCAWILSFMPRMLFLILKSSGLASSAISSSDKMHLLISERRNRFNPCKQTGEWILLLIVHGASAISLHALCNLQKTADAKKLGRIQCTTDIKPL